MANFLGFGSSGRRKNSKANRLRRMESKIKKLQKRAALDSALNSAQKKLETLRRRF